MLKLKPVLSLVAVAALLTFLAAPAQAAGDASEIVNMSFFEIVVAYGGWVGWVIIGVSVWTLAVIIEFFVNLRRDKMVPPEIIDELEALLEEDEFQEALELCESQPNFVTNCLASALPRINEGWGEMKASMEATAGVEGMKLQQRVGWLLFLSNLSPLLGLFGTVVGMIIAFQEIVRLGAKVTPTDLAWGISQALVTTFDGLVAGMPALFFYQYFRNRATRIIVDFGGILEDMTNRFRTR
jgi:biopolymer transport protein ExbB